MKKLALALLFVLALPLVALEADAGDVPALNNQGLKALLEKNRGKVIMLNFFATWCPPCRAEIPEIAQLRKAWPEDKLLIIGLAVDETSAPVPAFLKKLGANYPVYMAGKEVTDAWNVTSVPHNAFMAPDGRLIISEPGMADAKVLEQVVTDLSR